MRIRAFAAMATVPPVFSHWSAGVLEGLPVLSRRLGAVHAVVAERRGRGQEGVSAHLMQVTNAELVRVGDLVVTAVPRTVVDIAGASPFDEGVMADDAALRPGLPREGLEHAIGVAGARRASTRIRDVVRFAHPGAESAHESGSRVRMPSSASSRRCCSTRSRLRTAASSVSTSPSRPSARAAGRTAT